MGCDPQGSNHLKMGIEPSKSEDLIYFSSSDSPRKDGYRSVQQYEIFQNDPKRPIFLEKNDDKPRQSMVLMSMSNPKWIQAPHSLGRSTYTEVGVPMLLGMSLLGQRQGEKLPMAKNMTHLPTQPRSAQSQDFCWINSEWLDSSFRRVARKSAIHTSHCWRPMAG